jgi:hypothetical protein
MCFYATLEFIHNHFIQSNQHNHHHFCQHILYYLHIELNYDHNDHYKVNVLQLYEHGLNISDHNLDFNILYWYVD